MTGGRYDGLWSAVKKTEDAAYAAAWSGAIDISADKAVAEFSFSWETLTAAGLDLENLVIRPRSKQPVSRQPHITHGFRPVLLQANQAAPKHYRVSLHFAELSDVAAGDRVFDVELQGETVLKGFDPVAAGGGSNREVVRTFGRVRADRALEVRFVGHGSDETASLPPILSAVEVHLDK